MFIQEYNVNSHKTRFIKYNFNDFSICVQYLLTTIFSCYIIDLEFFVQYTEQNFCGL